MNQEEWLEYRRSLGLPADPAKDFPPGYRSEPAAPSGPDVVRNTTTSPHQRRKTESGQDEAKRHEREAKLAQQADLAAKARKTALEMAEAMRRAQGLSGPGPGGQGSGGRPGPSGSQGSGGSRGTSPSGSGSGSGGGSGPAYGRAPGPSTPPPPVPGTPVNPRKKSTRPIGCLLIFFIVFIGAIVKVIVPTAQHVFESFTGSGSNHSSTNTGTYSSFEQRKKEERRAAKNIAKESDRVMQLFGRGDPKIAGEIRTSSSSLYDTRLLTPAQAKAAMGPSPTWKRTDVRVIGSIAIVTGTLHTTAGNVPVELRMTKSGDHWEHEPLGLPAVRTSGVGLPAGSTINGTKVNLDTKKAPTTSLLVWPGNVKVALHGDKFTTYTRPKQDLKATEKISSGGVTQSINVVVDAKRTAEFNRQAKAAAQAKLTSCLSAKTLAPKNCPFGGSVPNSVSKIRNVHFTQTVPVKQWKVSGSYGNEDIWGTGGEVSVSATGWKSTGNGRGYTTNIRGTWETFVGDVAVKNGNVVFTSH